MYVCTVTDKTSIFTNIAFYMYDYKQISVDFTPFKMEGGGLNLCAFCGGCLNLYEATFQYCPTPRLNYACYLKFSENSGVAGLISIIVV